MLELQPGQPRLRFASLPGWAAQAAAIAVAGYTVTAGLSAPAVGVLFKPVPVAVLAVWILGLSRTAPAHQGFGRKVAAALALGALGDLLLERPIAIFPAGLGAFLVGHLTLLWALQRDGGGLAPGRAALVGLLIAPVAAALGARAGHLPDLAAALGPARGAPLTGPLQIAVAVYVLTLGAMAWRALARADRPGGALMAAGAMVFLLSDATLAWDRFVSPFSGAKLAVMSTYWSAQLLIAEGAARRLRPLGR